MKIRVVEYIRAHDEKVWYVPQYRRCFIWFRVPSYGEFCKFYKTFETKEEALAHAKFIFRDNSVIKRVVCNGND
ncbi:hypothetical protein XaC1_135 [Xanthomonas phage XaC1]|nr:hypothetical protein XaC1_135 [Xanthomonas phage XaC1]